MKFKTLSDPMTGLGFKAIEGTNGDLIVGTPFDGTIRLPYDKETDSYKLPKSLLRYRQTMSLTECAEYLGVSKVRVSRMCANGSLLSAKIKGSLIIDAASTRAAKEG
jgi:hypothetical protein